ncbi:saccharopine dehydrogenase NADP-binding domain-containing protein [Cupriavidus basilensis]
MRPHGPAFCGNRDPAQGLHSTYRGGQECGRARAYAAALAHPAVDALAVDARDRAALTDILRRYDVVVSTIGPYYLFGTTVLECAIDAGCHYIDICDDPEPTLDMLGLHLKARAAGITAIVGMGAQPWRGEPAGQHSHPQRGSTAPRGHHLGKRPRAPKRRPTPIPIWARRSSIGSNSSRGASRCSGPGASRPGRHSRR